MIWSLVLFEAADLGENLPSFPINVNFIAFSTVSSLLYGSFCF